jgi:hypothetical protein
MAILAPIANFAMIQKLIEPGSAANTLANLTASTNQFRIGIAMLFVVALLDILVAWALYVFLVPVNKQLSLLTAWLRLVYATLLVVVLIHLVHAVSLLSATGSEVEFSAKNLQNQVMLSLQRFNLGWEFALIVFGFHLLLLGYLIVKAGYMRKILGTLLVLAGLGYAVDGLGSLLNPEYSLSISKVTFIGELVLIFWLLIKGRTVASDHRS